MKQLIALPALLVLASCGGDTSASSSPVVENAFDNKTQVEENEMSFTAGLLSQLPECNTKRDEALGYVRSEKIFYSCSAKSQKWEALGDLKGDKGEKGETGAKGSTGATGSTGAAGADGNDNHFVAKYACSIPVYSALYTSGAATNLTAIYNVFVTSYGDVHAKSIITWNDNSTTLYGSSQNVVEYYPKNDSGNSSSKVTIYLNQKTGSLEIGRFEITLDRSSANGTPIVKYFDADLAIGGDNSITFSSGTCTKTTF